MRNKRSFLTSVLLVLMAMIVTPLTTQAQSEEPIISFHTNIYEKAQSSGITPSVSFVL
nr:hypothetical protein [Alloprevotella tannerae]